MEAARAEVATAAKWKKASESTRNQIKQRVVQRVVLVLGGGMSIDDLLQGSSEREAFCAQLRRDVSSAVGGAEKLDPERVQVHSLTPGSVIAKLRILGVEQSASDGADGASGGDIRLAAGEVAATLRQQLAGPVSTSTGIFGGQLTSLVDAAKTVDACLRLEETESEWAAEILAAVYHANVKKARRSMARAKQLGIDVGATRVALKMKKGRKQGVLNFGGFENIYRKGDKLMRDRFLVDAAEGDSLLHVASRQSQGLRSRGKGNTPSAPWVQRQQLLQVLVAAGVDPGANNCAEPPLSPRQCAPTLWLFENLHPGESEGGRDGGTMRSTSTMRLSNERLKAMELAKATFSDREIKKKLWRQLDGNGNGMVSLAEIDLMVVSLSTTDKYGGFFRGMNHKPALMRAFKYTLETEGDGDEWIQRHEFGALLKNLHVFGELYRKFQAVDTGHDNSIDRDEFQKGLQLLGIEFSCASNGGADAERRRVGEIFDVLDKDGGGKILFTEFCNYFLALQNESELQQKQKEQRQEQQEQQRQEEERVQEEERLKPAPRLTLDGFEEEASPRTLGHETLEDIAHIETGGYSLRYTDPRFEPSSPFAVKRLRTPTQKAKRKLAVAIKGSPGSGTRHDAYITTYMTGGWPVICSKCGNEQDVAESSRVLSCVKCHGRINAIVDRKRGSSKLVQ
jgi:hypothetical protein